MSIKIRNIRHTSSSETDLQPDEDTVPMIRVVWGFFNPER